MDNKEGKRHTIAFSSLNRKKRHIEDAAARVIFSAGGVAVIASIIAIMVFIVYETLPLWRPAKANLESHFNLKSEEILTALAVGSDDYRKVGYVIGANGVVTFFSLSDGSVIERHSLRYVSVPNAGSKGREGHARMLTSASGFTGSKRYALGTSDGFVIPISVDFSYSFDELGHRKLQPKVEEGKPIRISDAAVREARYAADADDEGGVIAAVTAKGELILVTEQAEESLLGGGAIKQRSFDLTKRFLGSGPAEIAIDGEGSDLYVGTRDGRIFHWSVRDRSQPRLVDILKASPSGKVPITMLGFLLGGDSLVVGDGEGNLSVWFLVDDSSSPIGKKLTKIHTLSSSSHGAPITSFAPSLRNRGLITGDAEGRVVVYYATSERKLVELEAGKRPVEALAFAPKADGIVAVNGGGELYDWALHNPHPEVSWQTLFGKVWYEGYDKPDYVWQSTGGSDDFEPKMSLTPLAFGTIKGTLYALLFAVPLAVLSALCVSQFMHPFFRNLIKPVVEIMAAVPSVVLGFLAGLWLAPLVEKSLPGVMAGFVVMPAMILLSVYVWRLLPKHFRLRFRGGAELLFLIPVVVIAIYLCSLLNVAIETTLLKGDFGSWLYESFGLRYDQRNALIVGIAMGFAVIPIIFSIAEDALSNVPKNLISGSLALGATPWQTAVRVVLPTASPGIFSAIMIGLGRAAGETMIVLMATGNTPIMDWSIFDGFRALSANIAVEMPEAPYGATLYRVLFLSALLLFGMTFLVNTAAEIVRIRLRRKFGNL